MDIQKETNDTNSTLRRYEARVLNTWVRLMLDTGEDNVTGFHDSWAEGRSVEVLARSRTDAIARLQQDYPDQVGFEISDVRERREQ